MNATDPNAIVHTANNIKKHLVRNRNESGRIVSYSMAFADGDVTATYRLKQDAYAEGHQMAWDKAVEIHAKKDQQ